MAAKAKKYTLKAQSGDGKQVCAFFSMPQGCRNGAKCPFVHDPNAAASATSGREEPPAPTTPASVTKNIQAMKQVKEEIVRAQQEAPQQQQQALQQLSRKEKKRRRQQQQQQQKQQRAPSPVEEGNTTASSTDDDDEPPAAPAPAPIAPPPRRQQQQQQQPQAHTKGNKKSNKQQQPLAAAPVSYNPFLAVAAPPRAAAAAPAAAPKPAANNNNARKPQQAAAAQGAKAPGVAAQQGNNATKGGGGLMAKLAGLPVRSFSVARKAPEPEPAPAPATQEEADESSGSEEEEETEGQQQQHKKRKQPASLVPPPPTEDHGGKTWHGCVEATAEHARFEGNYRVVLGSQKGVGEWIEPRKHGAWCKDLPHVVAIDCEMCATRDPVSMEQDGKALIRLSVVSGHDEAEVLLDTLVLPALPVIDYRSDIHGISPQDLRDVQFTFRHAQAAMLQLCCSETVVIGHGLCNDLTALKMRHARVVDTALLFEREDAPHHTPALKDVAKAVLGHELPDTHDSVADAQATLKVARHFLERGPAAPVPRLPGPGKKQRREGALSSCLLLHRLPGFVQAEHIADMFWQRTHVKPVAVDPVAVTGGSGRTMARFLSKSHADLAFHTLVGPARPDKDGRPQKRVYLKDKKDYCQVRLMYLPQAAEEAGAGAAAAGASVEVIEEAATSVKVLESVF